MTDRDDFAYGARKKNHLRYMLDYCMGIKLILDAAVVEMISCCLFGSFVTRGLIVTSAVTRYAYIKLLVPYVKLVRCA